MTSLHYTLIALGIGLVVIVMLYNYFQDRRSQKQAEQLFQLRDRDEDVSLSDLSLNDTLPDTRIEPRIHLPDEDSVEEVSGSSVEPLRQSEGTPAEDRHSLDAPVKAAEPNTLSAVMTAQSMVPESPLDPEIEYIARLRYAKPVALPFAVLLESLRRISKPIRILGQREDGAWESVTDKAARQYGTVELSILLADSNGPVSESHLELFCQRLYEFATKHGGAISCLDKAEAVAQANALNEFCASVDMLIDLNVMPPDGGRFDSLRVHELVSRAGLIQSSDGEYVYKDARGAPLFSLIDGEAKAAPGKQGVTLFFDVPRVNQGLAAFDRMTDLALEMADHLDGRLLDGNGHPIDRGCLERDRKGLEKIYARMAEREIPAGGERAMRLFA